MRYYVTADIHGFYTEFIAALEEKGFFCDKAPHKLIVCGDLYDRGEEAVKLQRFLLELLEKDQVILIRGNHEDLALSLINDWNYKSYLQAHHHLNGTVDTLCQLTELTEHQLYANTDYAALTFLKDPYIQTIIPATVNYFETDEYVFVHGWIPCYVENDENGEKRYTPIADWRNASNDAWNKARWINGMEAAHAGILVPGKTVVCGHWHCSFGHCYYENDGGEFDNNPNFTPYCGEGIIALDACTAADQLLKRSGTPGYAALEQLFCNL